MNNVMEMLTKSGYEAISIGNDVLPCTLKKGNELVGFLMEDFSVQLLPEHEAKRDSFNKAVSFALDNQGLETVQDEFKLSQYQNIVLTTTYDFEAEKPIYNIYSVDKEKNLVLLNSSEDKDVATRDFASRSGLVNGEIPTPVQETDRIGKFIDAIKSKGYSLAASAEEAHRAYEIVDQDNNTVGYIGKNNRVTITTDNVKSKRFLTDTYIDTNPNRVMLPSFFEKLKERLKEIGLALKVIFTSKGRHYAIQNEQHQEIATVSDKHEVTYTDQATKEQMAKIDAMVEEIRHGNFEKQNPVVQQTQKDAPQASVDEQQIEAVPSIAPLAPQPEFTSDEMQSLIGSILANSALTEAIVSVVLSDKTFLSQLNQGLAEKLTNSIQPPIQQANSSQAITGEQNISVNNISDEASERIKQEFYKSLGLLQTFDGFNADKQKELIAEMTANYGTIDPQKFETKLSHGDYKEPNTLSEKLEVSHRKADLQNAKNEQAQTKVQEKERA
jgi:hypothetical protein